MVAEPAAAETQAILARGYKARVIGQDAACEAIATTVQRVRAGLRPGGRPIGVFLFVGPSGVGKTEPAKATAALLFGSDHAMVRFAMREYMVGALLYEMLCGCRRP